MKILMIIWCHKEVKVSITKLNLEKLQPYRFKPWNLTHFSTLKRHKKLWMKKLRQIPSNQYKTRSIMWLDNHKWAINHMRGKVDRRRERWVLWCCLITSTKKLLKNNQMPKWTISKLISLPSARITMKHKGIKILRLKQNWSHLRRWWIIERVPMFQNPDNPSTTQPTKRSIPANYQSKDLASSFIKTRLLINRSKTKGCKLKHWRRRMKSRERWRCSPKCYRSQKGF